MTNRNQDPEEILEILQSGVFDSLIGLVENERFECKREPYRLDDENQKFELAKDVTSMANADGGLILIGAATSSDPLQREDHVVEIRSIEKTRIDTQQYLHIIGSWVWPKSIPVDVQTYDDQQKPGYAVFAIVVQPVSELDAPALVANTPTTSGKKRETLIGYFERSRAHTAHTDVRALHALIRSGRRYDGLIKEEFASLRAELRSVPGNHLNAESTSERRWRTDQALSDAGVFAVPNFVLTAQPHARIDLRGLFESRTSPLSMLVSSPPRLREGSFGIDAGVDSRIHDAESRRAIIPQTRILEMFRDGFFVFATQAEPDLCWATQSIGRLVINPVSLIEMTYLFVLTVKQQVELSTSLAAVTLEAQLNAREDSEDKFKLQAGPHLGRSQLHTAPEARRKFTSTFDVPRQSVEEAAFDILAEIYFWFGIEGDRIPYTGVDEHGKRYVSVQKLTGLRN